jgi:hypothetical protein
VAVWVVPIVVAIITGPVVVLLARFDRRNTEQHDRNMIELQRIGDSVQRVDTKIDRLDKRIDDHIDWHLDEDWQRRGRRDSA